MAKLPRVIGKLLLWDAALQSRNGQDEQNLFPPRGCFQVLRSCFIDETIQ